MTAIHRLLPILSPAGLLLAGLLLAGGCAVNPAAGKLQSAH